MDKQYFDSNFNLIKEGKNSVLLELIGIGEGICDVIIKDGDWYLYNSSQGEVLLESIMVRTDIKITNYS